MNMSIKYFNGTLMNQKDTYKNILKIKKCAVLLFEMTYKSTIVRDWYFEGIYSNKNFVLFKECYTFIYNDVKNNLYDYQKNIKNLFEYIRINEDRNIELSDSLEKFIDNISYYSALSKSWNKPVTEIEVDTNDISNMADFILGGLFKTYCDHEKELDESAQIALDKDICNRIYTLLCNGFLDCFSINCSKDCLEE